MGQKIKPKGIKMRANLPRLLEMAARDMQNPGISIGFACALSYLNQIAQKAIDKNDKFAIERFELCGIIKTKETK